MTADLPLTPPRAWTAEELRRDQSWIQRLSEEEVAGFEAGLAHAKGVAKDWLDMTAADFPLNDAARGALQRAFASTQTGYGICLLKGFPVHRWSAEDARLVHWGVGLHVGVARPQNRASQVMNDVRDEGGSYKVKGGRGYNTNAGLDFHGDSCDVVALLCLKDAKSGGTSMVSQFHVGVRRDRPGAAGTDPGAEGSLPPQLPGRGRSGQAAVLCLPDPGRPPRILRFSRQSQERDRGAARLRGSPRD